MVAAALRVSGLRACALRAVCSAGAAAELALRIVFVAVDAPGGLAGSALMMSTLLSANDIFTPSLSRDCPLVS